MAATTRLYVAPRPLLSALVDGSVVDLPAVAHSAAITCAATLRYGGDTMPRAASSWA